MSRTLAASPVLSLRRYPAALPVLAGASILCACVAALVGGWNDSFWLDEAWTLAVINHSSAEAVARQIYGDVNAPGYYLVAAAWTQLFGASNNSLRLLSWIFAAATPLVVLRFGRSVLPDHVRWTWAALLSLWVPGLAMAGSARCYSLLLLLSTLQGLMLLRWNAAEDRKGATAWSLAAAATALTHYHGWLLAAGLGLAQLARFGWRPILRLWPAGIPLAMTAGWTLFHLPRVAEFARPDVVWYARLEVSALPGLLAYLAGSGATLMVAGACLAAALLLRMAQSRPDEPMGPAFRVALVSLLGALVVLAIGFARPSFVARYLIPFTPGLLLGLVLLVHRWAAGRSAWLLSVLMVSFLGSAVAWAASAAARHDRAYSFEAASNFLAGEGARRVLFVWDHPAAPILAPEQLRALGGSFFKRDGHDIAVETVRAAPGADLNGALSSRIGEPGAAILWLYDVHVRGTAAATHPPDVRRFEPNLQCRHDRWGGMGVLACG